MKFLSKPVSKSSEAVMLSVTEIIGHNLLIASQDGRKVYEKIVAAFKEGRPVILSFKDGEDLTGAFLSDAIAKLWELFSEEQIRSLLCIIDIAPEDAEYVENTIYWKKRFLENPERFKAAAQEFLGDDDE